MVVVQSFVKERLIWISQSFSLRQVLISPKFTRLVLPWLLISILLFTTTQVMEWQLETELAAPQFDTELNDHEIYYASPYEIGEFSYFTTDSYITDQINSAVYSGLYQRVNAPIKWEPDLAESYPVQISPLTYTIEIKQDLSFSNGNPLTVEDVVFSYTVLLNPEINRNSYGFVSQYLDSLGMVVSGENQVTLQLKEPYEFYMQLLSLPIVEKSFFEERYLDCVDTLDPDACDWNDPTGDDWVGAGPFEINLLNATNSTIQLKKNPHYWNAENVKLNLIKVFQVPDTQSALALLNQYQINLMDSQYVPDLDVIKAAMIESVIIGDPAHQEFSLNHFHPYFGTGMLTPFGQENQSLAYLGAAYVRKAMSFMADRQLYIDEILEGLGVPAVSIIPPTTQGYDFALQAHSYNISKAKQFMEKAGFDFSNLGPPDEDGFYQDSFFNFTMLSPNTGAARNQWYTAWIADLPKIGIQITQHVSTGWDVIIPRTFGYGSYNPNDNEILDEGVPLFDDGGFDVFSVGYSWGLDFDPRNLYTSEGYCGTGTCDNFINYHNQTITTLISDYLTEDDPLLQIDALQRLQKGLRDDLPVIPILHPSSHWLSHLGIEGIDYLLLSSSMQNWVDVDFINFKPLLLQQPSFFMEILPLLKYLTPILALPIAYTIYYRYKRQTSGIVEIYPSYE